MQRAPVSFDVGEGSGGDAAVDSCLRHRWRNVRHESRIKRPRDEEIRAETQVLSAIGCADHVRLLGSRELGDGADSRELHLLVDRGGADVERATEDEGEAQDVVDLVRVVRPAGGNDGIGPHLLRQLGPDLGLGVGERQDERLRRHAPYHVGREHAGHGEAKETSASSMMSLRLRAEVSCAYWAFWSSIESARPL